MKVLRFSAMALIVFCVLFTAFFGARKIAEGRVLQESPEYKGVITVWQIDSFEGGKGSRRQFIAARAKEFSKKNSGVLFMVSSETAESAEEKFSQGVFPDLLSYGNGLDVKNCSQINIGEEFCGGKLGDKTYALPWCRGGYALIKKSDCKEEGKNLSSVIVSQGEYTLPLLAFYEDGYSAKEITVKAPSEAYSLFLYGKAPFLLGTQRDIERLKAKGVAAEIVPMENFTDLYQYLSITSLSEEKRFYAEKFAEYLLSGASATKLTDISMLSVNKNLPYEGDLYKLETAPVKKTISVFTDKAEIKRIQEYSLKFYLGDLNAAKILSNVPFLP